MPRYLIGIHATKDKHRNISRVVEAADLTAATIRAQRRLRWAAGLPTAGAPYDSWTVAACHGPRRDMTILARGKVT